MLEMLELNEEVYTKEDKIKALHYMKILNLNISPYQPEIRRAIQISMKALEHEIKEYR